MYTTVGTCHSFYMTVCCPGWIGIQPGQQTFTRIHVRLIKRSEAYTVTEIMF
jgi:hypothetical protein